MVTTVLRSRWLAPAGAVVAAIGALFPPLTVSALQGSMTAYVIQVVILMGTAAPLFGIAMKPNDRFRIHPIPALILYNLAFFTWFSPPLHHIVTHSAAMYSLSLATLFLVALALWRPLLRPFAETPTPMIRLGYILLATIPQTFVGLLMAITRPQYAVAGSILALASKVGLFVAFGFIFAEILRDDTDDDDDDRPGDAAEIHPDPDLPRWVLEIGQTATVEEPSVLGGLARRNKQRLARSKAGRRSKVVDTDQLIHPITDVTGGVIGGDTP
jgi:hypothetical protein